jgi:hypothetical protein
MTRHAHAVSAAPRMPAGNYTGIRERLEDAFVQEEVFNLGFPQEHEVLELGVPLEHDVVPLEHEALELGVRVESEIADRRPGQRSLPLSRRQARLLWGAANRVTRVIISGSTTVGSITGTFVSNATVGSNTWTFISNATVGSNTWTFVSNATVGSNTWTFVSNATVGNTGAFVDSVTVGSNTPADTPAVATTSQRDNFSSLRAELVARRADLANWDEDDGDRPNEEAFDDAQAFIGLIPSDVPLPSPYVSGDAEVGFGWGCGMTASLKLLFEATARSAMRPDLVET